MVDLVGPGVKFFGDCHGSVNAEKALAQLVASRAPCRVNGATAATVPGGLVTLCRQGPGPAIAGMEDSVGWSSPMLSGTSWFQGAAGRGHATQWEHVPCHGAVRFRWEHVPSH